MYTYNPRPIQALHFPLNFLDFVDLLLFSQIKFGIVLVFLLSLKKNQIVLPHKLIEVPPTLGKAPWYGPSSLPQEACLILWWMAGIPPNIPPGAVSTSEALRLISETYSLPSSSDRSPGSRRGLRRTELVP